MKKSFLKQLFYSCYKILGPNLSTQLALSPLGVFFFKIITGNKNWQIYEGFKGIKLKLSAEEALKSGFFILGTMNPYETNILNKVLKSGDIMIDVGAYVDGWHSLVSSKIVGKKGHVYCFEPYPIFFKQLKENVHLNKLDNIITLENLAVSDKCGRRQFFEAGLASSFYKTVDHKNNQIEVNTITLDYYIKRNRIKKIKLIKIDVEGAEMEVIRGAIHSLTGVNSPDLMVEVIDHQLQSAGSNKCQLIKFLQKIGYNAYDFSQNGLLKFDPEKNKQTTLNLYFSKKPIKT